MATSSTTANGASSSPSSSSSSSSVHHANTYAVDIRFFLVMLVSAMSVFFAIGVLTAPTPTAHLHMNINTNTHASEGASRATSSSGTNGKVYNLNERHVNFEQPSYEDLGTGQGAVQHSKNKDSTTTNTNSNSDASVHLPAGQHLLVDIKNVSPSFLNSEIRLSDAMVSSVQSAGLTLLSYHCHSLVPAGVSCVGVLLESHISFHTWPEEGVITLDLFTCGENPLLPVVSVLEKLFGVPKSDEEKEAAKKDRDSKDGGGGDGNEDDDEVVTLWSHELRGFRHSDPYGSATKTNYLDSKSDLASWVITPLDLKVKKQLVATTSEFHRIDIWEVLGHEDGPSYEDAMKFNLTEGDPRWLTPEIATPNRILFMNGALQSMRENEKEFHESLVQPAMFAHPNPRTIAIIGGGDGAVLREVLKHNTVEKVIVLELDELLLQIVKEHLPYMGDCSDIDGVKDYCLDDERVELYIEDAIQWFLNRYGAESTIEDAPKFDVIILDAFEPQDNLVMYNNAEFVQAVISSLSEDGTVAVSLGDGHTIHDPRASLSPYAPREKFMTLLEKDSGAMFVYEEAHTGFEVPSAFLVACKSTNCRDLWYADAMVLDYAIDVRLRKTVSSEPILMHFDGATHHSFQIPPRAWEEVYCRRDPVPFECDYRHLDLTKELFEVDLEDEDENSFDIVVDEESGEQVTAVYANEDMPKGSYIMPSELAASFTIAEYTHNSLKSNVEVQGTGDVSVIENFLAYIEKHGHKTMSDGRTLSYVEVGASFMIRRSSNPEEVNVGRWMPGHPSGKQPVYSPVYDRHLVSFDVFLVATKDIKEGDEIVKPENLW